MIYKKIKKCRNCGSENLKIILDLGVQSLTGKFPKSKRKNVLKTPLSISLCIKCKFVQLSHNFNNKYLYNLEYGYESGINTTMTKHLSGIARKVQKFKKLTKNNIVMDIASNDGTLLNSYNKQVQKIGVDPILKRFEKKYKNIKYKIPNFFSYNDFKKLKLKKKVDVITAFAVFYDINDPNKFLIDIKKILDPNGIFIMEQSNLAYMIKLNSFDTICQEHLGYYSTKVIKKILEKNGLKIFNHEYNDSNGGSSRYYITHKENKKIKINKKEINKALKFESEFQLGSIKTYKKFNANIKKMKKECLKKIKSILSQGKIIHGYGASTKGNVILQYLNLNNKQIEFISDRNPFKYNRCTPGTKIKIISEEKSRNLNPDYYFVLPWHFKKEILKREIKIRRKGTKFIFPLPNFNIQ